MALTPGTKLGSYEVLEHLGSGGMGEVYLAYDPRLDRRVAIKLLPAHLAANVVAGERLRREARAAAALDHPFICKIFEVAEDNSAVFIVMEYVRGETLSARMRTGPLPQPDALRIAGEIAEAIEEAHANRFVHRDLKPANIMLTPQGRIKVMDFGLAKKTAPGEHDQTLTHDPAQLTAQGAAVGTPEYMSPEQMSGAPVDHRSDLFSLGIVFCELFTAKHPFRRGSVLETMSAILRDPPDLSISGSTELPPGLVVLIRRLLAKSPDERYQSTSQLRSDLLRVTTIPAAHADSSAEQRIPLIGRGPEQVELLRLLESALAGHGSLVLIGGEPGIGKTHITRALLAQATRRGYYTAIGHCYEMEGAPPYAPFIETMEHAARGLPRESFRQTLGDAAPEIAKLMPELRTMFPDIPPPLELPPEQQRRFLFNAFRDAFERAARLTPMVLVLEDLHWADEPTLLLLQHLTRNLATIPVLLIGTYRDVELEVGRPFARILESLMREKLASRMPLRRLALDGVQAMLDALSGQSAPPLLARVVFEETEGNPFFVEEVFRHLAEEGKLFDDAGAWRPGMRVDQLQVPESVRLVIGRRLERLGAEARRVLTTAAVIGRSFSLRLLEDVESAQPDTALEAVEEAERAHLVIAEPGAREPRYRFVHELIRQTLAQAISQPRRQRLHTRISSAIERIYAANPDSQASALAHHLYQAGAAADPEKTLHYLSVAAKLASAGAAHEEALAHLDNALSLFEGERNPHAAGLHVQRALALRSLGLTREAVDSYELAAVLFIEAGNLRAAAEAKFHVAIMHGWTADGIRALGALDGALRLMGTERSPLVFRLLVYKATCLAAFDDIEAGFATLAEAKTMEASLPEANADGHAATHEARLYWNAAQLERADRCALEAIARFRAAGDLWGEADVWDPVVVALYSGRPSEVAALLRDSAERAERVGHQHAVALCKNFSAEMYTALGDLERAGQAAQEAFEFTSSLSTGWLFLDTIVLGYIDHYRGRFDDAARWFRHGIEIEPRTPWLGALAGGLFWTLAAKCDPAAEEALAKAYPYLPIPGRLFRLGACACLAFVIEGLAWLGRREEAAALQDHIEHVVANGPWCVYGLYLFRISAGIAAASAQNWPRAEEHYRVAIGQADTAPYRLAQPIARYWFAEMLIARNAAGDGASARALLNEALAMFESLGMPGYLRRASDTLASLHEIH